MTLLLALLQIVQPLSSYLAPGVGWRLYHGINQASSTSARITSRENQAFLIVRCDRQDGPILSLQYVPIETVGVSPGPVTLLREGDDDTIPLSWSFAATGAVAISESGSSVLVEAVRRLSGMATVLTVSALDGQGRRVAQHFDSDHGEEVLRDVLAACDIPLAPESANTDAGR